MSINSSSRVAGANYASRELCAYETRPVSALSQKTSVAASERAQSATPSDPTATAQPNALAPRPVIATAATDAAAVDESPLATSIKQTLTGDAQGNVHEEELQHALVIHLLEQEHPDAVPAYEAAFNQVILHASAEDAVKEALKTVVGDGLLSAEEAENINGMSFQAAQLDGNLTMLYDNKGSGSDPTIAVMAIDDAIATASEMLEKIKAGEVTLEARSLEAPSNGPGGVSGVGVDGSQIGGGFLWKPSSDRDGNLVVLFPPELSGRIESAGIYSEMPPSNTTLLETGRFSGDQHNGGRAHFRFTRPGGSYPDGVYVVAQLSDGTHVQFRVGETSQRNE